MRPMSYDEELALNRHAFEQQRERIRSEYRGQFVGFAFGRVVAAGPILDEVIQHFNAQEPMPQSGCVFRAEDEPAFEAVECTASECAGQ